MKLDVANACKFSHDLSLYETYVERCTQSEIETLLQLEYAVFAVKVERQARKLEKPDPNDPPLPQKRYFKPFEPNGII